MYRRHQKVLIYHSIFSYKFFYFITRNKRLHTDIVETKRKGFTDVVLSKKEYEKLTVQAEKYKQINEKNKEIKDNANKVKEAHKALKAEIKASNTIIE